MNADIARSWILANAIALAVSFVVTLIGYPLRHALGIGVDGVSLVQQIMYVGAEAAMSVFYFALFARLTGAVLGTILPGFSHLTWRLLHMVIGAVAGISFALSWLPPSDDRPLDWDDGAELVFVAVVFVVGGGLLGAAFGGLQAYVMRPVADGLRLWVVCSAAAVAILAGIFLGTSVLLSSQGLGAEMALAAVALVGGLIGALIMLPAVQRLRPRFR